MLGKLNKFLKNSNEQENNDSSDSEQMKSSGQVQSWFKDRYDSIVTQRNIMFLSTVTLLLFLIFSVVAIIIITSTRTFEPFVVQVEKNTGDAIIVNPIDKNILSAQESLTRFFIRKYINARESYNPVDFDYNVRKVLMLLSTYDVYRNFLHFIRNKNNDPTLIYGNNNTTFIKINSITKFDNRYFVRFSVNETTQSQRVFNKIATITIDYIAMELSDTDRDINPVGFVVTGYGVADDKT